MNIKDIIPKKHNKHDIMSNSFTNSTTNTVGDYIYYPHVSDQNSTSASNKQSSNDNIK